MTDRTSTPLNELAEAVVDKLKGISQRKDARYLTSPRDVKRLHMLGDFSGQKPMLAVSAVSCTITPAGAQRFDAVLTLGVHCITDNTADAEGELMRLVSDVLLALAADVTVGSRAQHMFPTGFEPNVDLINRTGLAVTTVNYECQYQYDSTAP